MRGQEIKLRYLLRPREEVNRPDLPVLSVYRDHGVIPKDSRSDNFNKTPLDLSRYQVVHAGDLVVNKMKAWQGSVAISKYSGIVSPDYLVCSVSSRAFGPYLHYLLRSKPLVAEYGKRSKGIRPAQWRLYWDDISDISVTLPLVEEQRRIAEFLNFEIKRIDEMVCSRKRQDELLEERAQSRVYNAIRGVGEAGPRRDSRLCWLGDVAEAWPILRVSSQFDLALGKMLNRDRASGASLRPYLRNTNVQWDWIDVDDLLEMDFPPDERRRYEVVPGDLLICEGGEPGRAAIWDGRVGEIYYQKALHRARSRGRSSARWLFYCLRVASVLNVFSVEGNVTTISHLTGEQLRAHHFPFPDRGTQDKIVARLDAEGVVDKEVKELLYREIFLFTERRQALITAAVTGQVDVATARGV